jgi:DNA-binding PadR family transcriptional regulator
LVLSILSQLKEAKYGYELLQHLLDKGMEIDQGTIYPMLRRLESQGILKSDWSLEQSRPRKYYVLSEQGLQVYDWLSKEWCDLISVMEKLLSNESKGVENNGSC